MRVVIVPKASEILGSGPRNGMWALQHILREHIERHGLDWLTIESEVPEDGVPWLWCDRGRVARVVGEGRPFVMGPNVLFADSSNPRIDQVEADILDATACQAVFCHSQWYRDLFHAHMGPNNPAEVLCWPYPVRPLPGPPEPRATLDLLVFVKSGPDANRLAETIAAQFQRSRTFRYGEFARQDLFAAGRCARAGLYLSDDESGGLVTQELMLAGCPVVGVERGAPLVAHGVTGIRVDSWDPSSFLDGIRQAMELDRSEVRTAAMAAFDEDRIARTILDHLNAIRIRVGQKEGAR